MTAWRGFCGVVWRGCCGAMCRNGGMYVEVSRNILDILIYVIKFSFFFKIGFDMLINFHIILFQLSTLDWTTSSMSDSCIGNINIIYMFTSLRSFIVRVSLQTTNYFLYYYNLSYYTYFRLILISPYYVYSFLYDNCLHIMYPLLFSFTHTIYLLTIFINDCDLSLDYFYYVVHQFSISFLFISVHYSASACTCMIGEYNIYMYSIYCSDIIQEKTHYVQRGKRMGEVGR